MQLKKTLFFFTFFVLSQFFYAQEYADKIDAVLEDNTAKTRGKLTQENGTYILHYFDVYEKDSYAKAFQEKGFHGGGPTWLALIYAALNIYEYNIVDDTEFDVGVSGVTFKSKNKEDLLIISRVIELIKSDSLVMNSLVDEAKKLDIMK